jgi:RecB family endonuclease NucS
MFLINRSKNEAVSLKKKTFQVLGFKERKHLQEWICKNTEMLGERLLIIQKEFSGFDDTNERLDLLALDEAGDIVIIENKLDDSGRNVTWQALKYVSYCSGLSKTDIKNIFQKYLDLQDGKERAEQIISEFLGVDDFSEAEINNGDQRIIFNCS